MKYHCNNCHKRSCVSEVYHPLKEKDKIPHNCLYDSKPAWYKEPSCSGCNTQTNLNFVTSPVSGDKILLCNNCLKEEQEAMKQCSLN